MLRTLILSSVLPCLTFSAVGQQAAPPLPEPDYSLDAEWPEAWFEIFRLAPGKHETFVQLMADYDEANAAGGLAPVRMYFHQHGADWDVLVLKISGEHDVSDEAQARIDAKARELGIPTGPAYFAYIRESIASHTDTKAYGPISAAQWLSRLEASRQEQGSATVTQ